MTTQFLSRRTFLATAGAAAAAGAAAFGVYVFNRNGLETHNQESAMDRYPIYRAEGGHRDLGRQHGEQAAEKIKAHLDFMASSMQLSRAAMRRRALRFQPLFERFCPHLVVELEGLAEGAGIALADALAVNIRGALTEANDGGCTAFAVSANKTAGGGVLIGQNSDTLPAIIDLGYVLQLKPQDKPEVLMWTFGGMIGYHGLNSRGVAHFANDLGGGPAPRFAMPHYPLKRLMLECSRLDEIQELFGAYPLWASGNYVICDADGNIGDIEATPEGFEVLRDSGDGMLVHANHFLSDRFATAENHEASAPDSFSRQSRLETLIRGRLGSLTPADLQRFLRDRNGTPNAICRSPQTTDAAAGWQRAGVTVASIVAEPKERRMHVALGNGEDARYVTYRMVSSAR